MAATPARGAACAQIARRNCSTDRKPYLLSAQMPGGLRYLVVCFSRAGGFPEHRVVAADALVALSRIVKCVVGDGPEVDDLWPLVHHGHTSPLVIPTLGERGHSRQSVVRLFLPAPSEAALTPSKDAAATVAGWAPSPG